MCMRRAALACLSARAQLVQQKPLPKPLRMRLQGRILWTMGGAKRDDPKEARTHFEIASCEECDSQARAWPARHGMPMTASNVSN